MKTRAVRELEDRVEVLEQRLERALVSIMRLLTIVAAMRDEQKTEPKEEAS